MSSSDLSDRIAPSSSRRNSPLMATSSTKVSCPQGGAGTHRVTSPAPARSDRALRNPAGIVSPRRVGRCGDTTPDPSRSRRSAADAGAGADFLADPGQPTSLLYWAALAPRLPERLLVVSLQAFAPLARLLGFRQGLRAWPDKPFYSSRHARDMLPAQTAHLRAACDLLRKMPAHASFTVTHFSSFEDCKIPSQMYCVRRASRKSGMAGLPVSNPLRKSAT